MQYYISEADLSRELIMASFAGGVPLLLSLLGNLRRVLLSSGLRRHLRAAPLGYLRYRLAQGGFGQGLLPKRFEGNTGPEGGFEKPLAQWYMSSEDTNDC